MPTITIDNTAGAVGSPRRHAAGLKPDGRRDIDAVAAREPGQDPLGEAGRELAPEQQADVALRARSPRRLRTAPKGSSSAAPRRAPASRRTTASGERRQDRRIGRSERPRSRSGSRRGRARSLEPSRRPAQSRPRGRSPIPFPKAASARARLFGGAHETPSARSGLRKG